MLTFRNSKKVPFPLHLISGLILSCLVTTDLVQAQVSSDGTLPTKVDTSNNLDFTITEGTQLNGNLFHSFREFSVPNNGSVIFANGLDVRNIFSRVTGNSISKIDGLIKTNGNANLFLINPNGIIFGPHAQLNIGGSFIASTASQINFADGKVFSATDRQINPLLTVSMPIGLQFRENPGKIINQSRIIRKDASDNPILIGLQVQPGKTLALVGGNVFLEGGILTTTGGRIEVGSVAAPAVVSLTPITTGWELGYDNVQNFQDIQLSKNAIVQTDLLAEGSGDIILQGRQIVVSGNSGILSFNDSEASGGTIIVKASESLEIKEDSDLSNVAFATGSAGDIIIATKRLLVRDDGSFIGTATESIVPSTESDEKTRRGNLTIEATESVEVDAGGGFNQLRTQTFGNGDAGILQITTGRLILRNGGQLSSSTFNVGKGGEVIIRAFQSIEASGQGKSGKEIIQSGVFSQTSTSEATGNGGTISIDTGRLVVQDGASISVAAVEGSTGQAGLLDINASESVFLSGADSSLSAISESLKPAGALIINTPLLTLQDGAKISASSPLSQGGDITLQGLNTLQVNNSNISASTQSGQAGSLQINLGQTPVNSVQLNQGSLTVKATDTGKSGNLAVNAKTLNLQNNSEISASTNSGEGGDITLQGLNTLQVNNSNISASTQSGRAGNLTVKAADSVQISGTDGLSVEATADGTAGNLTVETGQINVSDGAKVSVSSPQGQAGNLRIAANSLTLNRGAITAETGKSGAEGANITLQIADKLILSNESLISATANGDANGGNIDINAKFLIAFPPTGSNGSDIIAKAERGNGGNIKINAQGIFGIAERKAISGNQTNDIDASSEFGAPGQVEINSTIDPNRGIIQLPETVIDPNALVAQNSCRRGSQSQFTRTGRGGLPPSLNEDLNSAATQVGLVEPAPSVLAEEQAQRDASDIAPIQNPIVPAQGWIFNDKGEVVLTAYKPTVTGPQRLKENPAGCLAP